MSSPVQQLKAPDAPANAPTELEDSEIAERAYSYWEARGFQGGSPEEDWNRAVEELRAERAR